MNSKEDFDVRENTGMTSAGRRKFSTDFNAQSSETSAEKQSHANQEDRASLSGISDPLKGTEEPQAQILEPDIEIPHQAKITIIPLSSFPSILQQLLLATAEVRQAPETQYIIYIWPLIKTQEASSSFWKNISKSSMLRSENFTRHCSSPDVTADVKCSQITLEKQESDRKTARSYPLIVKSSNIVVSEMLKSLTNIKNKDFKDVLPLSSLSPIEEHLDTSLFKRNALIIYNGKVCLLYVMTHEDQSAKVEIGCHHLFLTKTMIWFITCDSIRNLTQEVPHALLSRNDAVKQNIKCPTTCATSTRDEKMSNETHSSSQMTTISQPKNCSLSTGKSQQFLDETLFPSKEGLQKRKEAPQDKDKELRKKFCVVKDVEVVLHRLRPSELRKYMGKAPAHKRKVTARQRTKC